MSGDETINTGDRVRLKGDLGEGRHGVNWMTVKRVDNVQPTGAPNEATGIFVGLAYWTLNDAGHPFLVEVNGYRPGALSKEPPPAVKRPSWGRTVKTPAGTKKRAKTRR